MNMKPSCININVCFICEVFRNEFRKILFYVQCVYVYILIIVCDVFKQFSKPFLRGTTSRSGVPFPHQGFLPLFFLSMFLYSLLQVTLLIMTDWQLTPSEAFRSCSQSPFDQAQLLFIQTLQTGQTVVVCFENLFGFQT